MTATLHHRERLGQRIGRTQVRRAGSPVGELDEADALWLKRKKKLWCAMCGKFGNHTSGSCRELKRKTVKKLRQ